MNKEWDDCLATMRSNIGRMLRNYTPEWPAELDVPEGETVLWSWDSAERGELMLQSQLSRKLDFSTLTYFAQLAIPSAITYRTTVLVDKQSNALRFVKVDIPADVHEVMSALEALLNQRDVLEGLLIDGPVFKRQR